MVPNHNGADNNRVMDSPTIMFCVTGKEGIIASALPSPLIIHAMDA